MLLLELEKLKIKVHHKFSAIWPKMTKFVQSQFGAPGESTSKSKPSIVMRSDRTRGQVVVTVTHKVATIQILTQNFIVCSALQPCCF